MHAVSTNQIADILHFNDKENKIYQNHKKANWPISIFIL